MIDAEIIALRLQNQQFAHTGFNTPADLVKWLGATQAQDYAAAKWAIGLRMQGGTDEDIDRSFNNGSILRTHVLRPTWHFVAPEDIRWIIALTAPRVKAQCAFMNRKMELNEAIFKQCNKTIIKALKGNQYLTRPELREILQKTGVAVNDFRLTYIMLRAELDAVVCSGPRKGKQFTYSLLEERVPESTEYKKEEALAMLALRYFASRGPAMLQDFVWWSGLATADAKRGLEIVAPKLQKETINEKIYWYQDVAKASKAFTKMTYLLPNYDEYIVAYKDRLLIFDPEKFQKNPGRNVIFNHTIVIDGKVTGTWKRTIMKDKVIIEPITFIKLIKAQKKSIAGAADNYSAFLGLSAEINW